MNKARLFVRVVELGDGTWEIRRGREAVAYFRSYARALEAALVIAELLVPSAIFVHRADADAMRVRDLD